MAATQLRTMLGQVRRLVAAGPGDDVRLLQRFVAARDAEAFELLVWRHGAMVFRLCASVCRSEQDAEDAFQATFLTLARKAGAIGRRHSLGSWLYKVAYRAALRARQATATRAARERPLIGDDPAAAGPDDFADVRALVRDEVSRLPEKYQRPLVLFHFEGKSLDEVALELGCAVGTVGSRLSRARGRLRRRLAGRGLAVSLAALAAADARAMPPRSLVAQIVGAVTGPGAHTVSTNVASLTEGVVRAMFWNKLKLASSLVLACAVVSTGLAGLSYRLLAAEDKKSPAPPAAAPAKGWVTLKGWGMALDPDGDCKFAVQTDKLTITLPGKDHALCIEQNRMNAPRVLRDIQGDFIAQVKVSGDYPKAAESVVGTRRPFHGAGMLLFVDDKTYIRLERAQVYTDGEPVPYVNFELRKDGEFARGGDTTVQPTEKGTYLRLERRGGKVYGSASNDGIQWAALEPIEIELPKTIKVGLVAGHNTSSGYEPAFEEWKIFREVTK
jgi:RNA polymerase sigma factor (sigma-70 family)